ncbi:LytTR family transcriptional regulator [Fontibacillus phaseoli]|uniref:LytTR family transcriptional regulator n=1 Tax=Fontibacillus phaseoli TaxID=1416533 RepID=A0A369B828_9BACL|nr:LytTR family transcriptional regulator DNA-binding domain-containing protein [Fontibacillus phaseoli]RCX17680.1 LytTR family transcriptional regulator [Fontibacillus phaseoli]
MERIQALDDLYEDGSTDVIELASGQCTVVQCNHNIGRSFIRSLLGEGTTSGYGVTYRGELLSLCNPETAKQVGFCSLGEGMYERLKVRDYLLFWAEIYEVRPEIGELLSGIGLEGKANERISRLSYSEKRLLGFARSILHDPELVIWEEPEQNLDLESCMIARRMISGLIRRDKAVLITCSALEQALSISNVIYRLNGSRFEPIALQEPAELLEPESDVGEEVPTEAGIELPESTARLSRLMVKTEDKYVFIDPQTINYIESNEGITTLFTKEGRFACAWTLVELEDKLKPFRFYRCHRSYIVNLNQIAELIVWSRNSYSLVLSDGQKSRIPLSKGKFEELKTIVAL